MNYNLFSFLKKIYAQFHQHGSINTDYMNQSTELRWLLVELNFIQVFNLTQNTP